MTFLRTLILWSMNYLKLLIFINFGNNSFVFPIFSSYQFIYSLILHLIVLPYLLCCIRYRPFYSGLYWIFGFLELLSNKLLVHLVTFERCNAMLLSSGIYHHIFFYVSMFFLDDERNSIDFRNERLRSGFCAKVMKFTVSYICDIVIRGIPPEKATRLDTNIKSIHW